MLAAAKWQTVSGEPARTAAQARFAAVRVRIADGPPQGCQCDTGPEFYF